jgi:putative glutamine amidotransferase
MRCAVSISASHEAATPYDFLKHNYVPYFEKVGITPILVPNSLADPGAYIRALGAQGVILTGGGDVDPSRYGQPNSASHEVSPVRDQTEARLLEAALEDDLPVLGICRGMQFLNVFFGGALVQDLPTQFPRALNHKTGTHAVTLVDGTLVRLLGTDRLSVNTYHHQGVTEATLAPVFDVTALSDADRVVEGVRHRAHCVFGIQWHPERPNSAVEADLALMHSFIVGTLWR